jgi:hypothetical protein
MFSFEEARQRVLERVEPLAEREQLVVKGALGRILAADVRAPFDIPPLPNSARDGYAVRGDPDDLHLRFREHWHCFLHPPRRRRTSSIPLVRRHGAPYAIHRGGHPDERASPPQAGADLT